MSVEEGRTVPAKQHAANGRLRRAIEGGCLEKAASALCAGGSPHIHLGSDSIHIPALCYAVEIGNRALVSLLLAHGADLNAECRIQTAAVSASYPAVVAAVECPLIMSDLLRRGADPNKAAVWNGYFIEPIRFAAKHLEALKLLRLYGARG